MSLVTGILKMGRSQAEALMTDSCIIRREKSKTLDETTGKTIRTFETIYQGKCRLKQAGTPSDPELRGAEIVFSVDLVLSIPMSVAGVTLGDEVTITSETDPDVGVRLFFIKAPSNATHTTARRFRVQEVPGGFAS